MTPDDDDSSEDESDTSDESGEQPIEEIPLSLDALLDILANERRRCLLEYLWSQSEEVGSFEAATKHTITKMSRKHGYQPNHDNIQVELQQHHLPKLVDAGIIEYDVRSQTIRYRENERLEALHEQVQEFELG